MAGLLKRVLAVGQGGMVYDLARPEPEVWDPWCPSGCQSRSPGVSEVESREVYVSWYVRESYHELALGKEKKGKGRKEGRGNKGAQGWTRVGPGLLGKQGGGGGFREVEGKQQELPASERSRRNQYKSGRAVARVKSVRAAICTKDWHDKWCSLKTLCHFSHCRKEDVAGCQPPSRTGAPHCQLSPRGSGLDVCLPRGISSQAQRRHHPFQTISAGPPLLTQQHIRRYQQFKIDQQRVTVEAVVQGPGRLLSALGESGSAFGRRGSESKWEVCN